MKVGFMMFGYRLRYSLPFSVMMGSLVVLAYYQAWAG